MYTVCLMIRRFRQYVRTQQPVRLMGETGKIIPAGPGKPEREDYEYERNGTAGIFMFTEPVSGKRYVSVRERRTGKDWAHEVRKLSEDRYPDADYIRLICDNLNTHKTASFYEAFPPDEAGKLIKRPEIHYTPKHGSWLNIAEIGLSVLTGQCLDRRIRILRQCVMKQKNGNRYGTVSRKVLTGNSVLKMPV